MIVGEGPGHNEARLKVPFVGAAGRLLDALLAKAGIARENVWVTNASLCLEGSSMVRLADGSLERIDIIVKHRLRGPVLSVDSETGEVVSREITGWHRNALNGRRLWRVSHKYAKPSCGLRDGPRAVLTGDHPVLTPDGFVATDQLRSGVTPIRTGYRAPTGVARDVAIGALLGDGSISRNALLLTHTSAQEVWWRLKCRVLAPFIAHSDTTCAGGLRARTKAGPFWRQMRELFYEERPGAASRKAGMPCEGFLVESAPGRHALATWYLDDGHLQVRPGRRPAASIRRKRAAYAEGTYLAAWITQQFGVLCRWRPSGSIAFTTESTEQLHRLIADLVPPEMQYKLCPEYRGRFDATQYDAPPAVAFTDVAVVSEVAPRRPTGSVYCIDVEGTHTFATATAVVHNCKPSVELAPPTERALGRKSKWKDLQVLSAVEYCNGRLRAEIEIIKPRVIVCFGTFALQAVTGRWVERTKRLPLFTDVYGQALPCSTCQGRMTMAWWACPSCAAANFLGPDMDSWCGWNADEANVPPFASVCGACSTPAFIAKVEKRKKRCPICGGRKTREHVFQALEADYKVHAAAGLVFRGPHAPDYEAMDLEARVAVPCAYVIGTYHPAFLDREAETKAGKSLGGQFLVNAAIAHLRKAARLLTEPAVWAFRYAEFVDDVVGLATAKSLGEIAAGARFTTLDIETDNKDPWSVTDVRCVGFHWSDKPSLVFNTSGLDRGHPLVVALCEFLESDATKCAQHGIYDLQVLWHIWGIELGGFRLDTMAAHNSVYPDEPHDLGHIAGVYTDSPPWKPPKKKAGLEVWESSAQLHAYNARDTLNTTLAMEAQLGEMEGERSRFVHDLDIAMFHVARDMERAGLPIDRERWEWWHARASFYADRDLALMRVFVQRPDFNANAAGQLQWALYDKAGPCRLVPAAYTEKGAPSANQSALLAHRDHPFVMLLLNHRRWSGLRSNILESVQLRSDWRVRTRWNPLGARTGRWSTGGEEHGRKGNFQNWAERIDLLIAVHDVYDSDRGRWGGCYELELFEGDRELVAKLAGKPFEDVLSRRTLAEVYGIRHVVKAPPGRKIVGADLEQVELRVMAALSGDPTLIAKCKHADGARKLEPDHDPHSYVAQIAFGEAFTGFPLDTEAGRRGRDRLRFVIKRVIYGLFYGAGPETILASIYDGGYEGPPLTEDMIAAVVKAIFRAFPLVREWRERTLREAERTGRVWDALIGRRREFPLLKIDPTVVYNFPIQSTAGSLVNLSLWELRCALPGVDPSALILAQVHDAIYIECADEHAPAVAALLERCMGQELALVEGAEPMPFPCKAKIGDSWIDL